MTTLLLFAFFSIAFSFMCSIWEAVLLSISPSYVQIKVAEGGRTGELLQKFKKDVNAPLTAILSLNTVAHTVGAILVGASTGAAFGEGGFTIPGIEYVVSYEVLVSVVMTLAILILSEIIPKNLGATYWKQLAPFTVKALNVLVTIFTWTGFIWVSDKIKKLLLRGDDPHGTALSRTEFIAMAEAGTESGELKIEEGRILKNLLAFESLTVHDVMTPRTVVVGARTTMTINEFYEKFDGSPFSRYPVFGETRDQVEGYVLKDMVYKAIIEEAGSEPLTTLMRDLVPVPQTTTLHKLIDLMLERREPIAMVVDEFGGLEGLVTMEDAMETLLGLEIMDEMDTSKDMQDLARNRWRKRAESMGLDLSEMEGNAIDAVVDGKVSKAVNEAVNDAVDAAVKKDASGS
ncbi:HlyC/CorC family transporter [Neolewinella aurantiaca]|uniref:HlyC/CorC family transporter n=1 Tax=Neolewinella aurantiaca TaxID=2602767 RepID=A0A5C7FZV9_9BACT|nr:hemolysin family protein [Neolewinella aurantiaca]TXF91256.1 HlyC/CorC family transporter [Neolewinella aurantiaca]